MHRRHALPPATDFASVRLVEGSLIRLDVRQFFCIAAAVPFLACVGGTGDSRSGIDVAAEFATVTAAEAELAAAREGLTRARAAKPGSEVARGPAESRLREAQATFDAAYCRSQKVLSRFLNAALNEAPRRFETKEALDLYAKEAASNGRYVLEHDGDRTAALDALSNVERAYRTLGLDLPREAASAMDELRRTPPRTPSPIASPPDAAPAVQAGFTRQRDRHRAAPERTRRPR